MYYSTLMCIIIPSCASFQDFGLVYSFEQIIFNVLHFMATAPSAQMRDPKIT